MTQPAKSQEPSMEEILASIRRIIADDDATKPQARPTETAQAPAPAPRPAAPPPRMQLPPVRPAPPPPRVPEREPLFEPAPAAAHIDPGHGNDGAGSDILDLTESMAAAPPPEPAPGPVPGFRTINAQSDVFFDDEPPPPPAPIRASVEEPVHHPVAERHEERDLLSTSASVAVDSAFGALASTVLTHSSRTIEDLVREMLRPMLKTWLDDNLPGMVERLVRAEIERVSRGRNS